jgi:hypothetical protein
LCGLPGRDVDHVDGHDGICVIHRPLRSGHVQHEGCEKVGQPGSCPMSSDAV